jgi:hypothetical protein
VEYTKDNLSKQKYGKLSFVCFTVTVINEPKRGLYLCDCGRLTTVWIRDVLRSNTTSCGHCNEIPKEMMAVIKFGKLRQTTPKNTQPGSNKKDSFTCDCGRSINVKTEDVVLLGKTSSCHHCSIISEAVMATTKFGRLRQTIPKDTTPGSRKKDDFTCDCGGSTNTQIKCVFNGSVKSCGHCGLIVKQWYHDNETEIRKLKCPIEPGFILGGPIEALEVITKTHESFRAVCPACKNIYSTRLHDIKAGGHLTCACISNRISEPAIQVSKFIRSLGFETEFEYEVNKLAYDVYVKSKNDEDKSLLIEYDGSRFHNGSDVSVKREARKEKNAIDLGYKFLRIKEADWKKNKDSVKQLIKQLTVTMRHPECKLV